MLKVRDLSFWYNMSEPPIVYKCDFDIRDGEFMAIVGESGGGKTTLLRLVCGLLQLQQVEHPESGIEIEGKINFNGMEIQEPCHEFGYVPQNFQLGLIPAFSARSNILLSVRAEGITTKQREHADELLACSGISDVAHLNVRLLSGGQQQRVAICRTLITNPKVLFMDEPFANLDSVSKLEMSNLLKNLRERYNLSLLLVTHDIEAALWLANKVLGVKRRYGIPEYKSFYANGKNKIEQRKEIEDWIGECS